MSGLGGFMSDLFGSSNAGPTPGSQPYYGGSQQAYQQSLGQAAATQQALQRDAGAVQGINAPHIQYDPRFAAQTQSAYGGLADATGMAQQAAAGNVPSAAAIQQGQGLSSALRGQLAAAASARGGAYMQSAAAQQAGQQSAALQAQSIGQAAQQRAQEMAAARAQYAQAAAAQQGAAAGMEQQDFGAGQAQAAMNQQQNQINNQQQLGLGQQALGYGQLGANIAGAQLGADQQTQNLQAQATAQNANLNEQNSMGLISSVAGMAAMFSDIRAKQDVRPAAGGTPGAPQPTFGPTQAGLTDQALAGITDPAVRARLASGQPPPQQPPGGGMNKAQAIAFLKGGAMPQTAPVPAVQPVAAPPQMAITSDERTKDGAGGAQHVADAYLDHLAQSAATYSYKDPAQAPAARPAGAKFGGVMAQDLETVPEIGRQLVTDTPRGKALEGGANLSAALMGLGRLHERLKALEARGGGGR